MIIHLLDKLKFIYSEKATKFCEISIVDLSYVVPVKFMVEISQNLWPSQNIWTLKPFQEIFGFQTGREDMVLIKEHFWN